jgi:hypothetical protein
MTTGGDRLVPPQFPDIDSFDIALFPRGGNDLDPFDDRLAFDCDFAGNPGSCSLPDPEPPKKASRSRKRCAYGLGIEAQRSARYLAYPVQASTIHKHLRDAYGIVTRKMLQGLIAALIHRCPLSARPLPPTRDQRRAKGGLMAWLDDNESMVLPYLGLHNDPA